MRIIVITLTLFMTGIATAQQYPASQKELEDTIIKLDAQAFEAYNTCDLDTFKSFFTNDLEFYHDKNGLIETSAKLIETMKTGMCNSAHWKLRREAIKNTLQVYPLISYGAILTGEHNFYVTQKGVEKLEGKAKFTHIWLFTKEGWKMSRVLSYDHQAVK